MLHYEESGKSRKRKTNENSPHFNSTMSPNGLVQRVQAPLSPLTSGDLIYLQRAIGNRAVAGLLSPQRAIQRSIASSNGAVGGAIDGKQADQTRAAKRGNKSSAPSSTEKVTAIQRTTMPVIQRETDDSPETESTSLKGSGKSIKEKLAEKRFEKEAEWRSASHRFKNGGYGLHRDDFVRGIQRLHWDRNARFMGEVLKQRFTKGGSLFNSEEINFIEDFGLYTVDWFGEAGLIPTSMAVDLIKAHSKEIEEATAKGSDLVSLRRIWAKHRSDRKLMWSKNAFFLMASIAVKHRNKFGLTLEEVRNTAEYIEGCGIEGEYLSDEDEDERTLKAQMLDEHHRPGREWEQKNASKAKKNRDEARKGANELPSINSAEMMRSFF